MSNLVSVIMPCYNAEKTISDSIKGVLSQTYSNFELLIINDCSTDNSLDIIYHCTLIDNRIKLFSTDKNTGSPSIPRNIGIHPNETSGMDFYTTPEKVLAKREMIKRIFTWKSPIFIFLFWLKKFPSVVKFGYGFQFTKTILLGLK